MREKKTIRESIGTPAKSMAAIVLFFGALLMILWAVIALVRLVLG